MSKKGEASGQGFRIDFVWKPVVMDEKTRIVTFIAEPDPRRYEWKEHKGEKYLYDKLDNTLIPKSFLEQCAQFMQGRALTLESPEIKDANEYVKSRPDSIGKMLDGNEDSPTFQDPSDDFLRSLTTSEHDFVILSLDLVGSTKLSGSVEKGVYARVIATVLREISSIVANFLGHVLKYTGDGLIAYFPAPTFIRKHDLAIDAAVTLLRIIYEGINPQLEGRKLQALGCRIGLDSGSANVIVIGDPATKQHPDLIGSTISLACKIQAVAPEAGIVMGETTYRHLHTGWRLGCDEYAPKGKWEYAGPDGKPYRLFQLVRGWQDQQQ